MSNLAKKRKVWRSERSTERRLRELQKFYVEGRQERVHFLSDIWKRIEKIKDRRRQPEAGLLHLHGQKKKAARKAVDKVRNVLEEKISNKLEEDGGKKLIYKLACDRDEESNDMKGEGR